MAIQSKQRNFAFVLTLSAGTLSTETITLAADQGDLEPGSVLGKVTASDEYVLSPHVETVGKEGAETATAILCRGVDTDGAAVDELAVTDLAEVKQPMLHFDASVDDDAKIKTKLEQLRVAHIKAR